MVASLLKFTQGATTDVAGRALVVDGSQPVVCSNGDNTGVKSWKYELLETPPGSALVPVTQGPSEIQSTFQIGAPDVPGSYRVRLTVVGLDGSVDVDIRNVIRPFPVNGFLAAPYQRNPQPLVAKPDELNVGGQLNGWMGDEDRTRPMFHRAVARIDGSVPESVVEYGSFVDAVATNAGKTLVIPQGTHVLDDDLLDDTVTLKLRRGAVVSVTASCTIECAIDGNEGGSIVPAEGIVCTIAGHVTAHPRAGLFDTSAGGSFVMTTTQDVQAGWWAGGTLGARWNSCIESLNLTLNGSGPQHVALVGVDLAVNTSLNISRIRRPMTFDLRRAKLNFILDDTNTSACMIDRTGTWKSTVLGGYLTGKAYIGFLAARDETTNAATPASADQNEITGMIIAMNGASDGAVAALAAYYNMGAETERVNDCTFGGTYDFRRAAYYIGDRPGKSLAGVSDTITSSFGGQPGNGSAPTTAVTHTMKNVQVVARYMTVTADTRRGAFMNHGFSALTMVGAGTVMFSSYVPQIFYDGDDIGGWGRCYHQFFAHGGLNSGTTRPQTAVYLYSTNSFVMKNLTFEPIGIVNATDYMLETSPGNVTHGLRLRYMSSIDVLFGDDAKVYQCDLDLGYGQGAKVTFPQGTTGTATGRVFCDTLSKVTMPVSRADRKGLRIFAGDGQSHGQRFTATLPSFTPAAPTWGAVGAVAAATTSSITIVYVTGVSLGDILMIPISWKYGNTDDIETPDGWTLPANANKRGSHGSDTTDSGHCRAMTFFKVADAADVAASTGSGTLTISRSPGAGNSGQACMLRISPPTGAVLEVQAASGAFEVGADPNWAAVMEERLGIDADDLLIAVSGVNSNNFTYSAEVVTATGLTMGAETERVDSGTALGSGSNLVVSSHAVTAGPATDVATYAMTASGSTADAPAGATILLRVRAYNGVAIAAPWATETSTVAMNPTSSSRGGASGNLFYTVQPGIGFTIYSDEPTDERDIECLLYP